MQDQTSQERTIADVARRHDVSTDAVETLLSALRRGGGTMAQFIHPDLGGMGQWSRGGMIMVGDMFNQTLKARVDRLCNELSAMLSDDQAGLDPSAPDGAKPDPAERGPGPQSQRQSQHQGPADGSDADRRPAASSAGSRWPASLGQPSATGSQNDMHYAVFPQARRLAIEQAGKLTVYDTGDHRIAGFSQQQSGEQSLTFTSQHGRVSLTDLPIADAGQG